MSQIAFDNRYMEFRLGEQFFAIPLLTVKEVIPKPEITPIPNMPSHFEGMINLRGQVLAVFDVRKKLGSRVQSNQSTKDFSVVIIVEDLGVRLGMTVDEVTRVLDVKQEDIGPAPVKDEDPASKFVSAVIRNEQGMTLVLLAEKLLEFEKYKTSLKVS
jgi:purine-binding chemotaxis protein CheW